MKYNNLESTINKLIALEFLEINNNDFTNIEMIAKYLKKYLKIWRKQVKKNYHVKKIVKVKKYYLPKLTYSSFIDIDKNLELINLEFSINFLNIIRLNYKNTKINSDFENMKKIYRQKIMTNKSSLESKDIWTSLIKENKIILLLVATNINNKVKNFKKERKIENKILKAAAKGQIRNL